MLKNKNILYGEVYCYVVIDDKNYILFEEFKCLQEETFSLGEIHTKVNHIMLIKENLKKLRFIDVTDVERIYFLIRVCNYVCKQPNVSAAVL